MVYPVFDSSSLPEVEALFAQFKTDPASVSEAWQAYFSGWMAAGEGGGGGDASKALAVQKLIEAWRTRGHKSAALSPLTDAAPQRGPELDPASYGLSDGDMSGSYATDGVLAQETAPLKEIISKLEELYAGKATVELGSIADPAERAWVQRWWEDPANRGAPDATTRLALYEGLVRANGLEKFLHTKFVGAKRFSVEGNDGIIPLLDQLAVKGAADGLKHMVMGMAHRGRLNVLCNLLHKPYAELFAAFGDTLSSEGGPVAGDVKYHLGKTYARKIGDNEIELQLLYNPSHLEAVNPLVLGTARAKADVLGEAGATKVLPILIHGDSAVAGQGVVSETSNLMNLPAYRVGGTLHFVLNNQVGFTADPGDAWGGEHCTDIFRHIGCPIVHVNADDLEACWMATRLAYEYRMRFGKDAVVDLVGYRRWGHNEGDDPTFTQPLMYGIIKDHPVPAEVYKTQLGGGLDAAAVEKVSADFTAELQAAFAEAQKGLKVKAKNDAPKSGAVRTAVSRAALDKVMAAWQTVPPHVVINSKVQKVLDERVAMLAGKMPLNWGAGETAAYGTLLQEGIGWRLTGQDVQRGTFSHRHAVMTDQQTGQKWGPLSMLAEKGAAHSVFNSALSENAVMGFEYGYALAAPETLVMWEAQFGDFANGAQVIADQFMSAAEAKWGTRNHLTILLPHGQEGQGPEHSSARLERWLQLCGQDNMTVVMPSTPAQIFHLLRRQALTAKSGGARKPLVVMTPKSLLRNPKAVSDVGELLTGAFMPVIADDAAKGVKKAVLCSGKVYYDLLAAREAQGRSDVALIRVEELYPWPAQQVAEALKGLKVKDVFWVQEEPKNMGAWTHVREYWDEAAGYLHYVGRPAAASPAAGTTKMYQDEQQRIVNAIFGEQQVKQGAAA